MEMIISLAISQQFSPQFIQDLQQVAQTILTFQGNLDSLGAVSTTKISED